MFDIGFWEFALIAIVALVVVGPDRLPGMARTAGQLIGRAKRTMRELKYDLEHEVELEEIDRLKDDITKKLDGSIDIEPAINTKDNPGT